MLWYSDVRIKLWSLGNTGVLVVMIYILII